MYPIHPLWDPPIIPPALRKGGNANGFMWVYSGGEAPPSLSGKHSDASAKRQAFLGVPLVMSLRSEEKIIILLLFLSVGLSISVDFEESSLVVRAL